MLPDPYLNKIKSFNSFYIENHKCNPQETTKATGDHKMFGFGRRDEDLFHTANCLFKGGMPDREMRQVLENLILSWGEDLDPKWIDPKVESALRRSARREGTIAAEVKEWVEATNWLLRNHNKPHGATIGNI